MTVENLGPCKKLVRIEVGADKVNEAFDTVTKEYQRQVSLPGFRPGKAPKDMVVKRFSEDISKEAKTKLTREAYQGALRDHKINAIGYPDIEEIQFSKGEPYQFAATVETAPEFELPEYKGIPAKREKGSVTDQDVERGIQALRERQTKFETVTRELRDGDYAVVSYSGTTEGKPITEIAPAARGISEQKNFWVEVKDTSFIPGFAKQLVGMKAGEKRTVNVDFPADFVTPQLQGKKGTYEVELVEVKEKVLPPLDDEFAKSYGAENLQKLRDGVREDLGHELKHKQDSYVRQQVIDTLLEKINVDLPESMVAAATKQAVYDIVQENDRRGIPKEALEKGKEQIYSTASDMGKQRVKSSFILHRIAEKEQIKVDQQDMIRRVQQMAMAYQTPVDKLVKELEKNDRFPEIRDQLMREKVVEFLVNNAKIEEVEPAAKA